MRALPELGMPALQLRSREAEHEDRPVARPLEQVSDELDESGVRPLEILEEERDWPLLRHPLEEDAPSAEQLLLCPSRTFLEPEQVKDPRLDEATLFVVDNEGVERHANLLAGRGGVFAFDDAGSHAHHLGERPEGDALAVRQAAAAMPPDAFLEPIDVLEELPAEPGLADARDARHRHEMCALLVRGSVEELLHEPQLAVTPDERRLESGRLQSTASSRGDTQGPPERHGLVLALERVHPGRGIRDGRLRGALRGLSDEDGAGVGCGLDARRCVDQVAGDHPLPLGAERDGGLAGENTRACRELGGSDLVSEGRYGCDQVECGPDCALGVVLGRRRRPPHGHDRVSDELLHDAAVQLDEPAAGVEVAGEEFAHLLGVAALGERREARRGRRRARTRGGARLWGRRPAVSTVPARSLSVPSRTRRRTSPWANSRSRRSGRPLRARFRTHHRTSCLPRSRSRRTSR